MRPAPDLIRCTTLDSVYNALNILKIGGVPEHFNFPWVELSRAAARGDAGAIELRWADYPAGTGAMVSALADETLDVAMLLTEGAVTGIARGGRFRIVSLYTRSPLVWGIHVPAGSPFRAEDDLRGARYAISRLGSGSHLMAYVHARERGWPVDELVFQTVGGLDGAIEAFAAGRADVFLWEKFMTKPLVDACKFRRVGEFAAPWPAFVVCASERALREKRELVAVTLERVLALAASLEADPSVPAKVAAHYGLLESDAADWLAATQWPERIGIDPAVVDRVAQTLVDVGVIEAHGGAYTSSLPR